VVKIAAMVRGVKKRKRHPESRAQIGRLLNKRARGRIGQRRRRRFQKLEGGKGKKPHRRQQQGVQKEKKGANYSK